MPLLSATIDAATHAAAAYGYARATLRRGFHAADAAA